MGGLDGPTSTPAPIPFHILPRDNADPVTSTPGWHNGRRFHHKDHRPLRRTGSMPNALRNHEAFTRLERDNSPRSTDRIRLEIDEELPLDDVEKLVVIRVLVPVIFAFDDAESNDGVIHPCECLVVPRVTDRIDDRIERDRLQRATEDIEMGFVWELRARSVRHDRWS